MEFRKHGKNDIGNSFLAGDCANQKNAVGAPIKQIKKLNKIDK